MGLLLQQRAFPLAQRTIHADVALRIGSRRVFLYLHGLASVRHGVKSRAFLDYALQEGSSFARVDLTGHGDSTSPAYPYPGSAPLSLLLDDIATLAAALEGHGRLVIVGASMGGLLALLHAHRHPDNVEALVLLGCSAGFVERVKVRATDKDGHYVVHSPYCGTIRIAPGLVHDAQEVLKIGSAADEYKMVSQIATPTLMVHGVHDDVVPVTHAHRLFVSLASTSKEFVEVDDDHRISNSIPAVLRAVRAFLPPNPSSI
eukprot:Sspe_Gene.81119::Locus_51696_Transcript_1_2_Confidence_0.750_Length_903::g.81119::m.81119